MVRVKYLTFLVVFGVGKIELPYAENSWFMNLNLRLSTRENQVSLPESNVIPQSDIVGSARYIYLLNWAIGIKENYFLAGLDTA